MSQAESTSGDSSFTFGDFCYMMGYTNSPNAYDSASKEFSTSEMLGFYMKGTDQLWVVTDAVNDSAALISTLAHEVTHALQDQHFDLTNNRATTFDGSLAQRFLVEGDAEYTSFLYSYDNPPLAWIDAYANFGSQGEVRRYIDSNAALSAMPLVATLPTLLPYVRGIGLVHELRRTDNWTRVDTFLNRPPTNTRNCLVTANVIARTPYLQVDSSLSVPALDSAGWTAIGSDQLGAVMINTLQLTATWTISGSMAAAPDFNSWNGDRVWLWRKGTDYLVGLVLQTSSDISAQDFASRWSLANPRLGKTNPWSKTRRSRIEQSGSTVWVAWGHGTDETLLSSTLIALRGAGSASSAGRASSSHSSFPHLPLPQAFHHRFAYR